MSVSNKKRGTAFERRFADYLASQGFWVHLMTQNDAGQPADIIAVKDEKAILIDCKVCEKGFFRLDRIEDNQTNAMELWKECGNGAAWFALEMPDGRVRMHSLADMEAHNCFSTILSREDILRGIPADRWVEAWK